MRICQSDGSVALARPLPTCRRNKQEEASLHTTSVSLLKLTLRNVRVGIVYVLEKSSDLNISNLGTSALKHTKTSKSGRLFEPLVDPLRLPL